MVVELSSGPQGKAAVDRRVAVANVRVAETVCTRAMCTEALTRIREQSRLAERAALVGQQTTAVGSTETAGPAGPQLQSSAARADGLVVDTRRRKESRRKKESRRRKKEAAMGEGQHEEMVKQPGRSRREDEETVALCRGAVCHVGSNSTVLQGTFQDTLLEPTAAAAEYVEPFLSVALIQYLGRNSGVMIME